MKKSLCSVLFFSFLLSTTAYSKDKVLWTCIDDNPERGKILQLKESGEFRFKQYAFESTLFDEKGTYEYQAGDLDSEEKIVLYHTRGNYDGMFVMKKDKHNDILLTYTTTTFIAEKSVELSHVLRCRKGPQKMRHFVLSFFNHMP